MRWASSSISGSKGRGRAAAGRDGCVAVHGVSWLPQAAQPGSGGAAREQLDLARVRVHPLQDLVDGVGFCGVGSFAVGEDRGGGVVLVGGGMSAFAADQQQLVLLADPVARPGTTLSQTRFAR